jgi:phage terminase large subunit-like protein
VTKTKRPPSSRADKYIRWIEKFCRVPMGIGAGKPVVLREWQRAIVRQIFDNPHGTRRAIISFGRKNGKTALASMLLLLHLCGPGARRNSNLYSTARSQKQAALIFDFAAKMIRLSAELSAATTIRDTNKQIVCHELGTSYTALSAEVKTSFGLSPSFTIHDELGQVRGPSDTLYESLETATGGQESPLSIIISTQAPQDQDLLSQLIDDAKRGADPRTVLALYTAPKECDPYTEEAVRAANPAFGDFLNAAEAMSMAAAAKRMSSRRPEYRNLILNQRIDAKAPFIDYDLWLENTGAPLADFAGEEIYCGLDLSATKDLTAFVRVSKQNGVWHVLPTFWLPEDGLTEKGRLDSKPYRTWQESGHLNTTPGAAIDLDFVALEVRKTFDECDVVAVAFDDWRFESFRPALERAGFSERELERFVKFRQGTKTMAPAVDALERAFLGRIIAHGNHPVLADNAANTVTHADASGNRKLVKRFITDRIDGMVALAMALATATTAQAPEARSFWEEIAA